MSCRLPLSPNRRLWAAGLLACCTLLLTSGCGPDYKSRGMVKGKVTKGGKSLTMGTVVFHGKDGITGTAVIDGDGNYQMPDAPVGECKVTVTVQELPMDPTVRARLKGKGPKMPEGPKNPENSSPDPPLAKIPKEVIPVDPKYSNADTSGLSFTVKKGEQTYNIEL
jgi:hypothetical protein